MCQNTRQTFAALKNISVEAQIHFCFITVIHTELLIENTTSCCLIYIYKYIQSVSGGTVNILGGGSMDYSE